MIRTTLQSSVAMQQGRAHQPRQLFLSSEQGGGGGGGGDSHLQCSLPWQ